MFERYRVQKYGRWHFGIVDHSIGFMLRVGPNPDYNKPLDNSNNKLLLFKDKNSAEEYIKNNLMEVK